MPARIFFFASFMIFLFGGCSALPDAPDENNQITAVEIYISQFDETSSHLKMLPNYSAKLFAKITPEHLKEKLSFEWILQDEVLDTADSFAIAKGTYPSEIPNVLKIIDSEKNEIEKKFNVIVNAPPIMERAAIPQQGDTLYGSENSSFLFKWSSYSEDILRDVHNYTLVIDGVSFDVGTLTEIYQSGFLPGKHTYSVFVVDFYGETDSLKNQTFFVQPKEDL